MIPASQEAADLMRSLSHPQRLLVLCALGPEEKTVADLRRELAIEQVPMSQQLMRLRADGLVTARRDGTTVCYRITRPEVIIVISGRESDRRRGRSHRSRQPCDVRKWLCSR
jgi:DNA-binding transcriptional ArsR family regulator